MISHHYPLDILHHPFACKPAPVDIDSAQFIFIPLSAQIFNLNKKTMNINQVSGSRSCFSALIVLRVHVCVSRDLPRRNSLSHLFDPSLPSSHWSFIFIVQPPAFPLFHGLFNLVDSIIKVAELLAMCVPVSSVNPRGVAIQCPVSYIAIHRPGPHNGTNEKRETSASSAHFNNYGLRSGRHLNQLIPASRHN